MFVRRFRPAVVVLAVLTATGVTGCQKDTPTLPDCSFGVEPASRTVPADAGIGSVHVSASSAACTWTAISTLPWITLAPPFSGAGSATVQYLVSANPGAQERSGTVVVGGAVHTVTQTGAIAPPCEYVVSPREFAVPSGESSLHINVATAQSCPWQVASDVSWLVVTSAMPGSGASGIEVRVEANRRETARTGTLTVAGLGVVVVQAGEAPVVTCEYAVAPVTLAPCMAGGVITTRITTGDQCPWTVASSASWLGVVSGGGGTGSAEVRALVASNFDAPRQGVLLLRWPSPTAGQNVQVNQAGCRYGVSRSRIDAPASGTSASFDVVQQSDPTECGGPLQNGCVWSAATTADWIEITTVMPRTGDDRVTFVVRPNASGLARTGRITVRDQSVEIVQAGQ